MAPFGESFLDGIHVLKFVCFNFNVFVVVVFQLKIEKHYN